MKNKTCCFTGHRKILEAEYNILEKKLKHTIINLIENGIIYFAVGGALGFDLLVEKIILILKKDYPQIKLILVLPCENQSELWSINDKIEYEYIKSRADKIIYISKEYTKQCMMIRNKYLIDNSCVCVCYLNNETGGTKNTVDYGKSKGIDIINLNNISDFFH